MSIFYLNTERCKNINFGIINQGFPFQMKTGRGINQKLLKNPTIVLQMKDVHGRQKLHVACRKGKPCLKLPLILYKNVYMQGTFLIETSPLNINGKKLVSSKKHTQFQTWVHKTFKKTWGSTPSPRRLFCTKGCAGLIFFVNNLHNFCFQGRNMARQMQGGCILTQQ